MSISVAAVVTEPRATRDTRRPLWLLAAGFAGLALWRLAEAGYGQAGPGGHTAGKRLLSLGLGAFYGIFSAGIVAFILGINSQSSGNTESKDLTAKIMAHAGVGDLWGLLVL